MPIILSPQGAVWIILIAGLLLRLVLGAGIGLGVDESYVTAVARQFSLSYFDHPPLHLWLIWLTTHITGSENTLILRLPFILLFSGTTWLMYRLTARLFGEWPGVWAALLLSVSAVFGLSSGSWVLPDGPLLFCMMVVVYLLSSLFFSPGQGRQSLWIWLAAGFFLGLGLLSKYHAALLVFGLFIYLLTSRNRRRVLVTAGPYLAVIVAFIIFSPVLIWNYQHNWVSFVFQGSRGAVSGFYPGKLVANIAGQAIWVLPWIWLPLIWQFIKGITLGPSWSRFNDFQDKRWFLCCLASGPILLFTVATLWGAQGLFHWQAPGYLLVFPLLGQAVNGWLRFGRRSVRIWLRFSVVSFLVLAAILGTHTASGWIKTVRPDWFAQGDPSWEALNWMSLPGDLSGQGLLGGALKVDFLVARHWIDAGKIDYAMGGSLPLLCLTEEPHHFAFMHNPADFRGKDALIIGRSSMSGTPGALAPNFDKIDYQGTIPIYRMGHPEFAVTVFYGQNFKGFYPLPYGFSGKTD
ncbi:glycosyltransferase family 39 protein [Sporomusa acidovorans]|uniref:Glycosyltransferase RgtA/B/C/D-like domain-containing protein n=1 Tax=Sporomusa acidovorans (strain ATCC 49682 / DSM 3132 / Mol) TaxID=1123286 RepID=A0ABZ3IZ76_SPOA4|nr:glycosyltransferase family 39 protein [Sporomusa acidovorans]OZC19157.1 dolichyl-phosphate-mannose-protein mannosyltransferase [Sporomusa acidovorans DSM 3132]SDF12137.1 Dolichyl-phosphate-mannose-protein mannosyltransferase [Sporomusa acidovorans]